MTQGRGRDDERLLARAYCEYLSSIYSSSRRAEGRPQICSSRLYKLLLSQHIFSTRVDIPQSFLL